MRFHWLLLSCLSFLLWALPAQAGRLLFWRFEPAQNRLVFTTDEGVQPRAQLIFNPTRVVIDLPGITLGRPSVTQAVGGTIKSVRVGQFDSQTARLVIEIAPGYTVDPQQVKIRGLSPTQWTVELPVPQRMPANQTLPTPRTPNSPPSNPSSSLPIPAPSTPPAISSPQPAGTASNSQDFQITRNGFFVRLERNGDSARIATKRSRDRQTIEFTLPGAILSDSLQAQTVAVNGYEVGEIKFQQAATSPPLTRITLAVSPDSPDWEAAYSRFGGIVLLPRGGMGNLEASNPPQSPPNLSSRPPTSQPATITAIQLTGSQLLIQADRAVKGQGTWNPSTGFYEIRVANAQLSKTLKGPQLPRNSPIYQLRIRQENPQTVVILIRPSLGVQLGNLQQPRGELLALNVGSPSRTAATPAPIPVPPAPNPAPLPPTTSYPDPSLPNIPQGSVLVAIDPGHGGKDPGAIGLGGAYEKDTIFPISQDVARILEQQGIRTMMTRSGDYFVSLQGRTEMSNRARADLFVSIHANAVGKGRTDINGLEVYYFGNSRLAATIHRSILRSMDVKDRGVRQARFYVLRRSNMPSALVEVGFLTGAEDAVKLANPAYRRQMAEAIARGILEYIQQNRL